MPRPTEAAPPTLVNLADSARLGPDPLREARQAFCRGWVEDAFRRAGTSGAWVPRPLVEWALDEAEEIASGIPLRPLPEVERELEQLSAELAGRVRGRGPG